MQLSFPWGIFEEADAVWQMLQPYIILGFLSCFSPFPGRWGELPNCLLPNSVGCCPLKMLACLNKPLNTIISVKIKTARYYLIICICTGNELFTCLLINLTINTIARKMKVIKNQHTCGSIILSKITPEKRTR